MNAPRAAWTSTRHLRVLARLLDDLIRQARHIHDCYFTPELIASYPTSAGVAALQELRAALDQLQETSARLQDASFNFRRACDTERKHRTNTTPEGDTR